MDTGEPIPGKSPVEAINPSQPLVYETITGYQINDARVWSDHVGKRAVVTLSDNSESQTITGRIVNFRSGGDLGTIGEDLYILDGKGQLQIASGEKIAGLKIARSDHKWQREMVSHMKNFGAELDLRTKVDSGDDLVVTIAGKARSGGNNFAITGKITRVELTLGYSVYKIIDAKGVEHLIDPEYLSEDTMIAYTEAKNIDEQLDATQETPKRLMDENFGERSKLIEDLIQNGSPFENHRFYAYYEAHPEEAEQLLRRWYGEDADNIIFNVKQKYGQRIVPLLVDPGIANRTDRFISFLEEHREFHDQPLSVIRSKFSEFLGNRMVFRGMMLSDYELARAKEEGILASTLLDTDKARRSLIHTLQSQEPYIPKPFPTSPREEMEARLTLFGRLGGLSFLYNSNLISVSAYREVAESLGYYDSHRTEDPDAHMYVFRIQIQEISVIYQEGRFDEYQKNTPPNQSLRIGKFEINEHNDTGVEMFIPYKIPASCIQEVITVETKPPKWEREFREEPSKE